MCLSSNLACMGMGCLGPCAPVSCPHPPVPLKASQGMHSVGFPVLAMHFFLGPFLYLVKSLK